MTLLTCGFLQRRRTRSDLIKSLKADVDATERRGLFRMRGLDESVS